MPYGNQTQQLFDGKEIEMNYVCVYSCTRSVARKVIPFLFRVVVTYDAKMLAEIILCIRVVRRSFM